MNVPEKGPLAAAPPNEGHDTGVVDPPAPLPGKPGRLVVDHHGFVRDETGNVDGGTVDGQVTAPAVVVARPNARAQPTDSTTGQAERRRRAGRFRLNGRRAPPTAFETVSFDSMRRLSSRAKSPVAGSDGRSLCPEDGG
jgi:hypothetical protein